MISLSWTKHKRPTKKRRREADEQRKKTMDRKQYLKSVKYCQRCGAEIYPNAEGVYALTKVFDKNKGIELLVCDECRNE